MTSSDSKTKRITVVDALRGFAIFAILLVHSQEHFMYFEFPDPSTLPAWLNALNQGTHDIIFALFAGKSYAIFALLFGLTFYIQQRNQEKKGNDFGYRFLWRLLLLVGFAFINAAIFPGGDILLLYAIMGVLLFFMRHQSNKTILIVAIIFLMQPMEWFQQIFGLHQINSLNGPLWDDVYNYTKHGSFSEFIIGNLTLGQKASLLWAIEGGRFFQTGGLFLLGYLIGRKGWFVESDQNKKRWEYVMAISAIAYVPAATLAKLTIGSYAGLVFDMWHKVLFTGVIVSVFTTCYWSLPRFVKLCKPLRSYGRMTLTNYIAQSYIGAILFFPIGLNLAPHLGMFASLFVAIGIFIFQVWFCNLWFKNHTKGPLESLWHKLTWITIRKNSNIAKKQLSN